MSNAATLKPAAPYLRYVITAALHTLDMLPRRKISYFAALLAFFPVAIPVTLLIPRDIFYDPDGQQVFVRIIQFLYVSALVPLLALFFGSTLIGEDIESNTFPYILTRPIPRSAWVIGKFLGYLLGISALLGSSLLLSYLACTRMSNFAIDAETITFFLRYLLAIIMGLGAYGAIALLLGALVKRPIIYGIALFFFWQRVALALPGYVDYLTVDKYVTALMPEVDGMPSVIEMAAQMLGIGKLLTTVHPTTGAITLLGMMALFCALTAHVTRTREYTTAHGAAG